MSWVGHAEVLKHVLAEAGADWHWRAASGRRAYRLGPDLDEEMPEHEPGQPVFLPLPVTPVLGDSVVQVHEHAVYYVGGEARPLMALLEGVPEWTPPQVQDVVLASTDEVFD